MRVGFEFVVDNPSGAGNVVDKGKCGIEFKFERAGALWLDKLDVK